MAICYFAVLLHILVNFALMLISGFYSGCKCSLYKCAVFAGFNCFLNWLFSILCFQPISGFFISLLICFLCSYLTFYKTVHCFCGVSIYILFQVLISMLSDQFDASGFANLIIIALCVLGIIKLSNQRGKNEKDVDIEIRYADKCVRFRALVDTGNFLVDPITGHSAIIAGADIGKRLLGLTQRQISEPVSAMETNKQLGFRLIPFKTIGCANGMLLAYKFEDVCVGEVKGSRLVAFAPNGLNGEHGYYALTGGNV